MLGFQIVEALPLLLLLFVSGGMGAFVMGLVEHQPRHIRLFSKPEEPTKSVELGFIGDVLIGGTTSLGVFFFANALFDLKIASDVNIETIFKIVSIGILSGVGGLSLLTKAASKFENEVMFLKDQLKSQVNNEMVFDRNMQANEYLNKGQIEQSLKLFNEILKIDATNEHAKIGKAKALRRMEKCEKTKCENSIKILKEVIEHNPSAMRAYYNIACYMCVANYDVQDVLKYLEKAIQISTKYIDFAKGDADFDSIQENNEFKELLKKYE